MTSDEQSSDPVLDPFLKYLKRYKAVVVAIVSLGAIPPLMAIIFNIGPPWPHRKGDSCFTTVTLWMVLIWVHSQWHGAAQRKMKRAIALLMPALSAFFLIYIGLTAAFVRDTPEEGYSVAIGLTMRDKYVDLMRADRALSEYDLLAGAEFDVMEVYYAGGVVFSRVSLLAAWIVAFGCLSAVTATFILLLERRAAGKAK